MLCDNPFLRRLMLIAAALAGLSMAGCNTMEGAGEDIEAGGEAIERSAEDTKPY